MVVHYELGHFVNWESGENLAFEVGRFHYVGQRPHVLERGMADDYYVDVRD